MILVAELRLLLCCVRPYPLSGWRLEIRGGPAIFSRTRAPRAPRRRDFGHTEFGCWPSCFAKYHQLRASTRDCLEEFGQPPAAPEVSPQHEHYCTIHGKPNDTEEPEHHYLRRGHEKYQEASVNAAIPGILKATSQITVPYPIIDLLKKQWRR